MENTILPPLGFILHNQTVEVDADGNIGDYAPPSHPHNNSTHNFTTSQTTDSSTSAASSATSLSSTGKSSSSATSDRHDLRVRTSPPDVPARTGLLPRQNKRNRRRLWRQRRQQRFVRENKDKEHWRTARRRQREKTNHALQRAHPTDPTVPSLIPRPPSSESDNDDCDDSSSDEFYAAQSTLPSTWFQSASTSPPKPTPERVDRTPAPSGQLSQKQTKKHLRQLTLAQARSSKKLLPSHPAGAFGDDLEEIDDSTLRIYFQNVNGLSTADDGLEVASTLRALRRRQVGIYGLVEPNQDFSQIKLRDEYNHIGTKVWGQHTAICSSSKVPAKESYKPGGTILGVVEKYTSRIIDRGSDPYGRWSWVTLSGAFSKRLTFMSGYRVCSKSLSRAGTTTTLIQQWNQMRASGIANPNPRKAFIDDAIDFITSHTGSNEELFLMFDANEPLHSVTGEIKRLIENTSLNELIEHRHGKDGPATYARGSEWIDLGLGTQGFQDALSRCGMLSFNDDVFSDHRGLFWDFRVDILFNGIDDDLTNPTSRRLKSTNPTTLAKYLTILDNKFLHHNVYQRADDLESEYTASGSTTPTLELKYQKLDREVGELIRHAERKCTRGDYGHPWSPTLEAAGRSIRYWKARRSNILNNCDAPDTLVQLRQSLQIEDTGNHSLAYVNGKLKEAWQHLKSIQADAQHLRADHLSELASAYADKHDVSAETALKVIAQTEADRYAFSRIRKYLGSARSGAITKLHVQRDIPDYLTLDHTDYDEEAMDAPPEIWDTLYTGADLYPAIINRNKTKLREAAAAPLATGPLGRSIGLTGTGTGADAVLDGTLNLTTETRIPEAQEILRLLKIPADHIEMDGIVTEASLRASIRSNAEKTSASPSGRHPGHYWAALQKAKIFRVHAVLAMLPPNYGFSPSRWENAIDVMLEKDPGSPKITRLRHIELLEYDLNRVLSDLFGRRLVHHALDRGKLGTENFGSVPGRSAIGALLKKILSYDNARQLKDIFMSLENDATGCYDRVLTAFAMIVARWFGLPIHPARCHSNVRNHLRHRIKTAHGVSSIEYWSTLLDLLYGIGQGSGAAPCLWLLISTILFMALAAHGLLMVFECVERTRVSKRNGDGFVDDTGLGTTNRYRHLSDLDALRAMEHDLQQLAQRWEKLLFSTGGALNLSKCFWVLIFWKWKGGRARLATIADAPASIYLTQGYETDPVEIKRLEPTAGYRSLGVRLAADGKFGAELKYRRSQARTYAIKLRRSPLSKAEAETAYRRVWSKRLDYCLALTNFTLAECESLQSPVVCETLSKMGFNRNMPRDVVFGPSCYGGMEFYHSYIEQGIGHVRLLLGHVRNDDDVGEMIWITLSHMQLALGTDTPALCGDYEASAYVEPCWLTTTWEFLSSADLHLEFTDLWVPRLQRVGDVFLMAAFRRAGATLKQCERLNTCRFYLQVTTLSDVCSPDGKTILRRAMIGASLDRNSRLKWPKQSDPPASTWALWRRFLRTCFLADKTESYTLHTSLGSWLHDADHQTSSIMHDTATRSIYITTNGTTCRHEQLNSRRKFSTTGTPCSPPSTSTIAEITENEDMICLSQYSRREEPVTNPAPPVSIRQWFRKAPAYMQRLWGTITFPADGGAWIIEQLLAGKLQAGCDGSVKQSLACHSWLFDAPHPTARLSGRGPTDGHPDFMSTFRPEMEGTASIGWALVRLLTFYIANHPSLRDRLQSLSTSVDLLIWCDNKSTTQRLHIPEDGYHPPGITPHLTVEYDVESESLAAREALQKYGIKMIVNWVASHQDDNTPTDDLELPAVLNVASDQLCHDFWDLHPSRLHPKKLSDHFPNSRVSLRAEDWRLTGHLTNQIRRAANGPALIEKLCEKNSWSRSTFHCVDWTSHEMALKGVKGTEYENVIKLIHEWWNTGTQRVKIDPSASKKCPLCDGEESYEHILRCHHDEAVLHRHNERQEIWKRIGNIRTAKIIKECILHGIDQWLRGVDAPHDFPASHGDAIGNLVSAAIKEQHLIGWGNVLKGHISSKWTAAQDHFLRAQDCATHLTGKLWTSRLIRSLWRYAIQLWYFRNGILHGTSTVDNREKRRAEMKTKITDAYRHLTHKVRYTDRFLFDTPLAHRLASSVLSQVQWYEHLQAAMDAHRREIQDAADAHTKITHYFQYRRTLRPRTACYATLCSTSETDDTSSLDSDFNPEDTSQDHDDDFWCSNDFHAERIKGAKYARAPTHQ